MKLKLGLVSSLAASAVAMNSPVNVIGTQEVGQIYGHEYVVPNVEEICFSVRPVLNCDNDHVARETKLQKVGFHCMSDSLPLTRQYKEKVENGEIMNNLSNKSKDVYAFVETPLHCEKIVNDQQRERKEVQQNRVYRVHLLEGQDEQQFSHYQNYWDRNNHWDSEKPRRDWQSDQYSLVNQLLKTPIYMHSVLNYNQEEYYRLMKDLKTVVHVVRPSEWNTHFDQALPTLYTSITKQVFKNLVVDENVNEEQREIMYQEYIQLAKRIYAYMVRQVLSIKKMPNHPVHYEFDHIISKVWARVKRELTIEQIEEVETWSRQYNIKRLMHKEQAILDNTLFNERTYRNIENNIVRVLAAGLTMVNHRKHPSDRSVEYNQYHDQKYERVYKQYYPNIFSRLDFINFIEN